MPCETDIRDWQRGQEIADAKKKALEIKDSGDRTSFETGAVRDGGKDKGRYDLLPWDAIHQLAVHCQKGAEKYGERNAEQGIPVSDLMDSAARHISKYMRGRKDENHAAAALWNIAFAIYTETNKPELQDVPGRIAGEGLYEEVD